MRAGVGCEEKRVRKQRKRKGDKQYDTHTKKAITCHDIDRINHSIYSDQ